jgi:hypothetical protein
MQGAGIIMLDRFFSMSVGIQIFIYQVDQKQLFDTYNHEVNMFFKRFFYKRFTSKFKQIFIKRWPLELKQ